MIYPMGRIFWNLFLQNRIYSQIPETHWNKTNRLANFLLKNIEGRIAQKDGFRLFSSSVVLQIVPPMKPWNFLQSVPYYLCGKIVKNQSVFHITILHPIIWGMQSANPNDQQYQSFPSHFQVLFQQESWKKMQL